jgi:hypothetical protein
MIMHIIRITLEEFVYKDIEGKTLAVFQEHVVAFQIRFAIHTVHDHTVPVQLFKKSFNHTVIVHETELLVKKKPALHRLEVILPNGVLNET